MVFKSGVAKGVVSLVLFEGDKGKCDLVEQ